MKFSKEKKIVVFEKFRFLVRDLNNKELEAYNNGDLPKKIKKYSEGNLNLKIFSKEENMTPNNQNSNETTSEDNNLGLESLNPMEKYLYERLKDVTKQ